MDCKGTILACWCWLCRFPTPDQQEEFSVLDQIQKAQENEDPEKKRRIKYYLELQDAYLKHIQLGTALGSWQVGTYFFARDASVFVRLQFLFALHMLMKPAARPHFARTK